MPQVGPQAVLVVEDTLDDLMREVMCRILDNGAQISPSRGKAKELVGVLLQLRDTRARISLTETRGKPFSALGEFCWYLAGSRDADFISYYVPKYREYQEDGQIYGAYGPRLFDWKDTNQLNNVIQCLRTSPDTRRAVIQLYDAVDIVQSHKDVPCTCTIQFLVRDGLLNVFTTMRSNDAYLGLPHDIFCFTMLQEVVANTLSLPVGMYMHAVGSLHLYDEHSPNVYKYLNEGWQSSCPMPPMPSEDPWEALKALKVFEEQLRKSDSVDGMRVPDIAEYWKDLMRLLLIFRLKNDGNIKAIRDERDRMYSNVLQIHVDKLVLEV